MPDHCDFCDSEPGRAIGPSDLLVCQECFATAVQSGALVEADTGGWLHESDAEEHPFRIGRHTMEPLGVLLASTPDDETTAGTKRILARGVSGKLGIKQLVETAYVSRAAPHDLPEEWEVVSRIVTPGLFELVLSRPSNDKVLRELLGVVETVLDDGKWVALVAVPRQFAYEFFVLAREVK